jgi:hypothetical protein
MRTYKSLTLIGAIAITTLELLVFAHASVVGPQVELLRSAAVPQAPTLPSPSNEQTGDAASVSGG